ncbi:MAG: hypothetical protein EA415_00635 [Sphaerobacteraceae bacterium]|nr:MAG: hypothetical protein EA415_00635 [Sphaerobacteraceae bacterium]
MPEKNAHSVVHSPALAVPAEAVQIDCDPGSSEEFLNTSMLVRQHRRRMLYNLVRQLCME